MMDEKVKNVTSDSLGANPDKIKRESRFIKDLGASSLDIVELIMKIEEEFNISIPDDKVESLDTIGHVVDYLEELPKT